MSCGQGFQKHRCHPHGDGSRTLYHSHTCQKVTCLTTNHDDTVTDISVVTPQRSRCTDTLPVTHTYIL